MKRPAAPLVFGVLGAALVVSVIAAVRVGAVGLSASDVALAILGRGDVATVTIVRELRLPRALLAALVGGGLAASGVALQALLRNPLAEPSLLGVSSGAATGAVIAIVTRVSLWLPWAVPVAAFIGALVAVAAVLRLAMAPGRVLDPRTLLLAGVVVGAFLQATILLALTFADADTFRSAIFWMMGSLGRASWPIVGLVAIQLTAGLAVLLGLVRALNVLTLGEEMAKGLGAEVERVKWLGFGAAILVTAAAVASCGVIGFVGLIVPHAVRLVVGNDHRVLLPASILGGAAFLCLADLAARVVSAPAELPIGVVTAFAGVPFFLVLLRRRLA